MSEMYPWVTKTWTPIGGACPIACPYCYVRAMAKRFPALAAKYSGEPRLVGPWPRFKAGDVVFVCHMTDLFAMPFDIIEKVLAHCSEWPQATYVFQSKVPWVMFDCTPLMMFPCLAGTTFETDWNTPHARLAGMRDMRRVGIKTFITIEPIMCFSSEFASKIIEVCPSFVNIGADSKRSNLPEPTAGEVLQLIVDLRRAGIEVRIKPNLRRIMGIQ